MFLTESLASLSFRKIKTSGNVRLNRTQVNLHKFVSTDFQDLTFFTLIASSTRTTKAAIFFVSETT